MMLGYIEGDIELPLSALPVPTLQGQKVQPRAQLHAWNIEMPVKPSFMKSNHRMSWYHVT